MSNSAALTAATYQPTLLAADGERQAAGTLLVVTYYGLKEPIDTACRALAKHEALNVVDYPLFRFRNDQHDKTPHYIDMLCDATRRYSVDAVLFWYHGIDEQEMRTIRQNVDARVPFMIFNWDDPFAWRNPHSSVPQLARHLDGALTCARLCPRLYEQASERAQCAARYCLPGYCARRAEQAIRQFAGVNRFCCDVIFLCTNLYESAADYPHQRINRAALVTALYAEHCRGTLTLHLYGPEFLGDRFPRAYQGYAAYERQYELLRTARLVLTTHVVADVDDGAYANERTCVALGAGALLASDVRPHLQHDVEHDADAAQFIVDLGDSVAEAVQNIAANLAEQRADSERFEALRERAAQYAARNITWRHWAARVAALFHVVQSEPDVRAAARLQKEHGRTTTGTAALDSAAASTGATNTTTAATDVVATLHGALMPGHWEGDDVEFCGEPLGEGDVHSALEEDELRRQLESTTLAPSTRPADATPALGYARQRELSDLFDRVASDEHDFGVAGHQLLAQMQANPQLAIDDALDEHWRRTDAAP